MNIVVTGSSGLIGSALVKFLTSSGHEVTHLVRSKTKQLPRETLWNPAIGAIDLAGLEGMNAVVHLAGENIAAGRWTKRRKARILDSRIQGTRLLSESLASLAQPPTVLASASAVGYYGDRGEELLDEASEVGSGFLAAICREWEEATQPAAQAGIRVVHLRFGMVLSGSKGALAKMLTTFRLGLGGRMGSGRQYVSWIALNDVVGAIHHCLTCESLHGPVNLASPNSVTNREFTTRLAKVLKRPAFIPVPTAVLRLALGEMGNELLLASTRVQPTRLLATGYQFHYPDVEGALRHELGRPK